MELSQLYLSRYGIFPVSVEQLSASASNRSYCRMTSDAGRCIGCVGTDRQENEAFVTISRHLRSKGIAVPEVYAVSEDGLSYLQEDFGDEVLYDKLLKARRTEAGMDEVEELLCSAMSLLPKIQFEGGAGFDFKVCYPQPTFDRRMVMFDLNYFKYCFLKATGLEFNEMRLQDDFERLADDLLEDDTDTFMYRDFNARNVMVCDGKPCFIDFQGGRRGPVYYDVASFVYHARAGYTDGQREKMLDAYLEALSEYKDTDRKEFLSRLRLFVLFRLLQVLGAYGFRGWIEHKSAFITSIPAALDELGKLLEEPFEAYPYLMETLKRMRALDRFKFPEQDGRLEVRIYSFSFRKGIPEDASGNGGGYVFDCRSIHNPGRYEPYKKLTGRDEAVIRFLEEDGEVLSFLDHVYGVVDPHVETFSKRGFTSLLVSFGCTGGQHRSVYCAEHLARHLVQKYPDVRIRLIHREQNIDTVL